jgi:hypothetical protein
MNQEKLPKITHTNAHKRRLRVALLTAYEKRSIVSSVWHIIKDIIKPMQLGKKSTALATLALFAVVVAAGVAGPSASEVVEAEAVNTVKRGFSRLAQLTEEERLELKEQHKLDLQAALEEALVAEDLEIVDAPEMPKRGFLGKMGRSFGMHPMHKGGDWIKKFDTDGDGELSEEEMAAKMEQYGDKGEAFKEHKLGKGDYTAKRDYTKPVKFMQYTDSEGNKVTLGVDENDVPVMKFIEGEHPFKGFKKFEE